jgi:Protein of unknown function DUF262
LNKAARSGQDRLQRASSQEGFLHSRPELKVVELNGDSWRRRRGGGKMHYTNSEMKIDQLIGYFNEKKISLIPPFQRGHVWKLGQRQKLLENMVTGRPVPAIFLYKEPDGSKFTYNILDGKQRLESLLLFIGNERPDMMVSSVRLISSATKKRE